MKIMLADDEMSVIRVVREIVTDMGHEFYYAVNGKNAIESFAKIEPDLVILDIMMPLLDGIDVCAIIRKKSDVPIIFLSAKADILDKSMAYKIGGDDYLTKPFSNDELELKIEAFLRRANQVTKKQEEVAGSTGVFICKNLRIDLDNMEVFINDEKVFMSTTEFSLLRLLVGAHGQPFTRSQIINAIWGQNNLTDHNTLTVFIRKIREKLEIHPSYPEYILTVWGVGYKMAAGEIFVD